MTEQNKLQVVDSVRGTALENYADRSVVRELMNRLMSFHPAHTDVGEQGMLMAAQIAILMGASPLPGTNEIHIWLDKGKPKVEPGINYWQRRGDQKGGVLWDIEPRPMSESEMEMYQIDKKTHYAAICRGIRIMDIAPLREFGLPINQIMKMKGVVGIGVATKSEYAKNGRPPVWTAIKRAKTDFFKMAFPFIPGEIITPGAGMIRNEQGQIEPDYTNPQWGNELGWDAQEPVEYGEITDGEADEINDALFDMADPVIIDSEPEPIAPPPDDETIIMETSAAEFFNAVVELVDRYDNVHAAKNAAKKLGFAAIPKDVNGRIEMYRSIKAHAADRDAEEEQEWDLDQLAVDLFDDLNGNNYDD
jgi:hypothetical protein